MIAVVTTVRNGMPFIEEAVRSVRGQILDDYQHWVVDDGSIDGTSSFLEAEQGGRLKVVLSPPIGRGCALNLGVAGTDAEFIAILDADDVAGPIWLSEMQSIMQSNPDIAVLTCHAAFSKLAMDISADGREEPRPISPEAFLYRNPVSHSGTLIRRRVLLDSGGYDNSRQSLFDYELWVRLLCLGHQIWAVNKSYVFKRIHRGQHFEGRKRLSYLRGCYVLRRKVSREILHGKGKFIPLLGFCYGLLPQAFRHWRYARLTSRKTD